MLAVAAAVLILHTPLLALVVKVVVQMVQILLALQGHLLLPIRVAVVVAVFIVAAEAEVQA
jgi:hypothetical protein